MLNCCLMQECVLSPDESAVLPVLQVLSVEEVERIMDETQDAIEYQRVRCHKCRKEKIQLFKHFPGTKTNVFQAVEAFYHHI